MKPLLEVENLTKQFVFKGAFFEKKKVLYALNQVSFSLEEGKILGVIGESGSGKSTLAHCLMGLEKATEGSITFRGRDVEKQIVFQDPTSSLNPRRTVFQSIAEPLIIQKIVRCEEESVSIVARVLEKVGLSIDIGPRYPHTFSGGQQQRIAIARALILNPKLLILDESLSALDLSVQAQIIKLLVDLRKDLGLTLIFITHDLRLVEAIADEIVVLYFGHVVEKGPSLSVLNSPKHPYTQALLSSIPKQAPWETTSRLPIGIELPSPFEQPPGCPFEKRCRFSQDLCKQPPPKREVEDHSWSCVLDDS